MGRAREHMRTCVHGRVPPTPPVHLVYPILIEAYMGRMYTVFFTIGFMRWLDAGMEASWTLTRAWSLEASWTLVRKLAGRWRGVWLDAGVEASWTLAWRLARRPPFFRTPMSAGPKHLC